jgi:BMFP domain-containing protein YqiC
MTRQTAVTSALIRTPEIAIVLRAKINLAATGAFQMTQTSNRFFDEIGRLMNDAAGAAQGVKREVDSVVRNQAERILRDLDLVKREEFDAIKDMARLAREENEALKTRIAVLETKLGMSAPAPDTGSMKADG